MLQACAQSKKAKTVSLPEAKISDSSFNFLHYIPGSFTQLQVDALDNIYAVTSSGQLKKMTNKGDSISVYNDVKNYGNPSLIDVSNPMKILVYYRRFATVVLLDRLLTYRSNLNFRTSNIFAARAVAVSYDNYQWIFDEQSFTLKKIDDAGKVLLEGNDLRTQIDEAPMPQYIFDNNRQVYTYDISKGFYIYDYYGAYKNKIPLTGWQDVSVSGNTLYGFKNKQLMLYDTGNYTEKIYSLPGFFTNAISTKAMNGKMYLLRPDGIFVYEIINR